MPFYDMNMILWESGVASIFLRGSHVPSLPPLGGATGGRTISSHIFCVGFFSWSFTVRQTFELCADIRHYTILVLCNSVVHLCGD